MKGPAQAQQVTAVSQVHVVEVRLHGRELGDLALGHLPHLGVILAEERLVTPDLVLHLAESSVGLDEILEVGALLRELLELVAAGNDGGVAKQPLELLVAAFDLHQLIQHLLHPATDERNSRRGSGEWENGGSGTEEADVLRLSPNQPLLTSHSPILP